MPHAEKHPENKVVCGGVVLIKTYHNTIITDHIEHIYGDQSDSHGICNGTLVFLLVF